MCGYKDSNQNSCLGLYLSPPYYVRLALSVYTFFPFYLLQVVEEV